MVTGVHVTWLHVSGGGVITPPPADASRRLCYLTQVAPREREADTTNRLINGVGILNPTTDQM